MTDDAQAGSSPPHRPAEDEEVVFFEGCPRLRSHLGLLGAWTAAGLVVMAVPTGLWLADHPLPWWLTMLLFAAGLGLCAVPFAIIRTTRYRVTNYRIDYERGVLGKRIDTLELWHVDDISFRQSLWERLLGVGTITVLSNDQTTPSLPLRGLPRPRPIYESLKQRVIAVKRQRGVIKMDIG